MLFARMPFPRVPCSVWIPERGPRDAYGNENVTYSEDPDIVTECSYAPSASKDDIEQDRPHGDVDRVIFYLPKTFDADLRDALISVTTTDAMSGQRFRVVGDPHSYMRDATPGDMSWAVEGVRFLG